MEEQKNMATDNTDSGQQSGQMQSGNQSEQRPQEKDEIQVMREQLSRMETQLKEANARLSDPSYIEYLAQKAMGGDKKPAGQEPAGKPVVPELPEDFEDVSPAQFLDMVKSVVANEVLPQVGQVAAGLSQLEARLEIERVAQKYNDFDDYIPVMQKLAEENPYLHPEQAYFLAKSITQQTKGNQQKSDDVKVISVAEKVAKELRGSGALPGEPTPSRERVSGKKVSEIAGSLYDRIFGG